MKKNNLIGACSQHIKLALVLACSAISLFTACNSDDVGGNLYTFKEETLGQHLINNPQEYSEFTRLLDTTGVIGLLNAYGAYTCFAPDNAAMKKFYQMKGKKTLSDFSADTLKLMAYDHIINGNALMSANFAIGRLGDLSMSDRYFSISRDRNDSIVVNNTSIITDKDIIVHNGVIHKINEVLNPTRSGIVEVISQKPEFSIFYEALIRTGMADSLLKDKDKTYDPTLYKGLVDTPKDANQWFYQEVPNYRKYGYTVLMESNATMNANNITDLQSLKVYAASIYDQVYPEDKNITDLTDRRNSLNRFVSYHLINKELGYSKFIDAYDTDHMLKTCDMYEYIETMCPNTLIEIKKERTMPLGFHINKISDTGFSIQIKKENLDKGSAANGIYHEIDGMLVYDQAVRTELSSKRLRFDAASFFPELTNNNMRGRGLFKANVQALCFQLPRNYISRITSSEQTIVGYFCPYEKFQNYEGDEIFLKSSSGNLYDFSIVTPPIPAGNYEVRFGYLSNGKRGVAQLYFDNVPTDVPLNLNTVADDPSIGFETPKTVATDYDGYQNDKMMRNRGYMKGPACYKVPLPGWTTGENARFSVSILRKILGTYTFSKTEHHVFTVKGLSGGEFMFDYLEFVPTSALENEDIY